MADRDENGRFAMGNQIPRPGNKQLASIMQSLRLHFAARAKTEDLDKIYSAMLNLALNGKEERTQLAAQCEFLNRCIGKVREEIELNTNANTDRFLNAMDILRRLESNQQDDIVI